MLRRGVSWPVTIAASCVLFGAAIANGTLVPLSDHELTVLRGAAACCCQHYGGERCTAPVQGYQPQPCEQHEGVCDNQPIYSRCDVHIDWGPSNNDICKSSSVPSDVCEIPEDDGWCVAFTEWVCTQISEGCVCRAGEGKTDGVRKYCGPSFGDNMCQ